MARFFVTGHSRYEPEYLRTMFSIFVVEFENEDKQGKPNCQSRDANDGQPAQNLRQNIGQRIDHRHRPGEADKNTMILFSIGV
jgi:hypothetical protein